MSSPAPVDRDKLSLCCLIDYHAQCPRIDAGPTTWNVRTETWDKHDCPCPCHQGDAPC